MSPHIQLQYLSILSLLLKREMGVFWNCHCLDNYFLLCTITDHAIDFVVPDLCRATVRNGRSTSCETGQKISTKACSICFWSSWKHFFLYFQQMYVYCLYIPFPLIFPDHWRCLICQCFNIVPWKPISLQIFVNCVPSSQKLFFAKKTGPERCKKALRFCQVTRTVCFSIPPWEKKVISFIGSHLSFFIFPQKTIYLPYIHNYH
jgi:hypothetical protein